MYQARWWGWVWLYVREVCWVREVGPIVVGLVSRRYGRDHVTEGNTTIYVTWSSEARVRFYIRWPTPAKKSLHWNMHTITQLPWLGGKWGEGSRDWGKEVTWPNMMGVGNWSRDTQRTGVVFHVTLVARLWCISSFCTASEGYLWSHVIGVVESRD